MYSKKQVKSQVWRVICEAQGSWFRVTLKMCQVVDRKEEGKGQRLDNNHNEKKQKQDKIHVNPL